MKNVISVLLILIIVFFGWQFFNLYIQHRALEKSSENLNTQIYSLESENKSLNSDIEYFSNSENLEKELKSQTNYKDAGENMIIIIPPKN